ncbi:MAG TPA: thioredoxin-dependent thiol peroxidase [Saprospiraceae bacterium]|nr:thioredoxin-dependent thiol peroxidase [Saprospiraceae bacterium]MCB9329157.1 thioredoxin-dependent thiol peroxidase [Lewinellaceae bacterium]HPK09460.1 thioredoxin-dependent thiol peroxidase [Saprospiraceae bacterium]HPQ20887.1 thioredoxin-dependent thiol peroxidase [Saprospiraceae bacterium]
MLKTGDLIGNFDVKTSGNNDFTAMDLKGNKNILIFYPKDNTPGCTAAACSVRDSYEVFKDHGYKVYGISPDPVEKHQSFIKKFGFQYELLSDPEHSMINVFGVWGPKKFMGKSYEGLLRTTFVTDENLLITHVIDKVKTKVHAQQLRELLGI